MTTFFIDPENGNNGLAGTSFATAWKTVNGGPTFARTAAGDTIRIKTSPITDMGQTATWTNKSATVTLTTAVTKNIACNSGSAPSENTVWTAVGAGVTTFADTTFVREGAKSAKLTYSTSGTTGVLAYIPLGSAVDFSAYEQISFSLLLNGGLSIASNFLEIHLCSDVAGVTVVNQFFVPTLLNVSSVFIPITLNNLGPLGASIQSISIYANTGFGTTGSMYIDNIIACKQSTASDSLTLNSLIGKNTAGEGSWWAIRSINDTAITLDSDTTVTGPSPTLRGFSGTTGSAEIWKLQPWVFTLLLQSNTIARSGTDPSGGSPAIPITYSGGWDSTNMSTQVGLTIFDHSVCQVKGWDLNTKTSVDFDSVGAVRASYGFYGGGYYNTFNECHAVSFSGSGFYFHGNQYSSATGTGTLYANQGGSSGGGAVITDATIMISLNNLKVLSTDPGFIFTSAGRQGLFNIAGTLTNSNNGSSGGTIITSGGTINSVICSDNNITGLSILGINNTNANGRLLIKNITSTNNTGSGISIQTSGRSSIKLYNINTSGNSSAIGVSITGTSEAVFHNTVCAEATPIAIISPTIFSNNYIYSQQEGGTVNNHVIRTDGGIIRTEVGADRHTLSGTAWKTTFNSLAVDPNTGIIPVRTIENPISLSVAKFAVNSGALVTVSGYIKLSDSANVAARLRIPGYSIAGITSDVTADCPAVTNVYQLVTMTFTPTEQGVVEVFFDTYQPVNTTSTSAYAFIDDMSISQA